MSDHPFFCDCEGCMNVGGGPTFAGAGLTIPTDPPALKSERQRYILRRQSRLLRVKCWDLDGQLIAARAKLNATEAAIHSKKYA